MEENEAKISCLTFQKQAPLIEHITKKINSATGVKDKAEFADELQKETDVLLNCPDYNEKVLDCKNCHFIATLRKKTAELIIKAKKLSEA